MLERALNTATTTYAHEIEAAITAAGLAGSHIRWPLIDIIWDSLSPAERDGFVRRRLLGIWDSIERVTA